MDAILAVNAGSSSLKFQTFGLTDAGPQRRVRGQMDGIGVRPRMRATEADGTVLTNRSYRLGEVCDLPSAIAEMRDWLQTRQGAVLRAIGHRVVHGGPEYDRPVLIDDQVLDRLARCQTLAPLHQPNNLAPIRLAMVIAPDYRWSPASTPLSAADMPKPWPATPCRASFLTRESAATASMVSATNTSPGACPRWRPKWRTAV